MSKLTKIIIGISIGLAIIGIATVAGGVSVFLPFQGGTGTGTSPSLGQTLVGNSGGSYTVSTDLNIQAGTITTTGTITSGDITIFDATPILIFQDSNSLGASSIGYIEWRDSGGGRAGFFGNNSAGNDDLFWKNEQGGNIGIQTTGAGNLDIIATLAQFNATPITTTGTGTFGSTYQAILGDDGNTKAGSFTDGVTTVTLADSDGSHFIAGAFQARIGSTTEAGYFTDGTRIVYLTDGTYAINAEGDSLFDGTLGAGATTVTSLDAGAGTIQTTGAITDGTFSVDAGVMTGIVSLDGAGTINLEDNLDGTGFTITAEQLTSTDDITMAGYFLNTMSATDTGAFRVNGITNPYSGDNSFTLFDLSRGFAGQVLGGGQDFKGFKTSLNINFDVEGLDEGQITSIVMENTSSFLVDVNAGDYADWSLLTTGLRNSISMIPRFNVADVANEITLTGLEGTASYQGLYFTRNASPITIYGARISATSSPAEVTGFADQMVVNLYGAYISASANGKEGTGKLYGVYIASAGGAVTENWAYYNSTATDNFMGKDGGITYFGTTNQVSIAHTGNITTIGNYTGNALFLTETTAPTPVAGQAVIWTESNNELFLTTGDGNTHLLHGDSFSNIWFHAVGDVEVAISTQDVFTLIDSFTVVGHEDELANMVGNTTNNTLTLSAIAGGEYEISYHGSITATGGADKEMIFALGITLATPLDITNVTDNGVSPIVITSAGHGLENGDMVEIIGVLGNTAANGSYIVDAKATDTFTIVALDGGATTGNGDYNEGSPTGDITIIYPGNMEIHRMVRGADFGSISATGIHVLAGSDVLSIYVANLGGTTNLTVSSVSFSAFRIGD